MFENKSFEGIYYTRFIASWLKVKGNMRDTDSFKGWLRSLEINGKHLNEDEIYDIYNLATNGKLELEIDASRWLANKSDRKEEES